MLQRPRAVASMSSRTASAAPASSAGSSLASSTMPPRAGARSPGAGSRCWVTATRGLASSGSGRVLVFDLDLGDVEVVRADGDDAGDAVDLLGEDTFDAQAQREHA